MAIKKMDPTPYLMAGESVILKAHAKQDKLSTIEVALSYVILFLTIIGDCFIIGTAFMLKELKIKESGYILLLIALFVVHIIPFIFWFVYSIKKLKQKYVECITHEKLPLVLYYGTDRIIREVPRRGHIKNLK